MRNFRLKIFWTSFFCILISHPLLAFDQPTGRLWGVGCPIGRATFVFNAGGDIGSGAFYDVNYTYKYNERIGFEWRVGLFTTPQLMEDYDDPDNDELWTGDIVVISFSPHVYLLTRPRYKLFSSIGIDYYHMTLDAPLGFLAAFDFDSPLEVNNRALSVSPVDAVGGHIRFGCETALNETVIFISEVGYLKSDFKVLASWRGQDRVKHSARSQKLSLSGLTLAIGLKVYFPR
ncbi:hypothetical protein ACFL27_05370 [candidate division CSSED10-310 bacterium]|uniref:Outer membrane protein beta-barrel domain-containing protein n=1 Tax=candidate division CSSED10-310 bacterium TaxID=2855610 RepID=A0ABV6YTU6_UNCC1